MITAGYRWPLYDTSPTLIPLRRIDSEIIHFGRTNHQPDNAQRRLGMSRAQHAAGGHEVTSTKLMAETRRSLPCCRNSPRNL
jgi:hypothetical protein